MGLLDDVLGNLAGGALGGTQQPQPGGDLLGSILGGLAGGATGRAGAGPAVNKAALLAAAFALLQQHGGLSGVLDLFRGNGLGAHADSWLSGGPNLQLAPEQLQQVFGKAALGQVAGQLGLSHGDTSTALAQVLPELINQFSPQGELPEDHDDLLSQGLSLLRGQLG